MFAPVEAGVCRILPLLFQFPRSYYLSRAEPQAIIPESFVENSYGVVAGAVGRRHIANAQPLEILRDLQDARFGHSHQVEAAH